MIIQYYKKVFLLGFRFYFEPTTMMGIGSLLGGVSGFSGIFGGGGSSGTKKFSIEDAIQRQHEMELSENNLAGREGQKSTIPAPQALPTSAEQTATKLAAQNQTMSQWGKQIAGQSLQTLAQGLASQQLRTKISGKDRIKENIFQSALDKDFIDRKFPGTNPWEQLGSSSSASSGGGTTVAGIHGRASENVARTGAAASRDTAQISSAPAIKRVELEYQEAPYLRGERQAHAGLMSGQTQNVKAHTKHQVALNKSLPELSKAMQMTRIAQTKEQSNIGQIAARKGELMNIQKSGKDSDTTRIARSQIESQAQKGLQEVSRSNILMSDSTVKKAAANLSRAIAESQTLANVAAAIAALVAATNAVSGTTRLGASIGRWNQGSRPVVKPSAFSYKRGSGPVGGAPPWAPR